MPMVGIVCGGGRLPDSTIPVYGVNQKGLSENSGPTDHSGKRTFYPWVFLVAQVDILVNSGIVGRAQNGGAHESKISALMWQPYVGLYFGTGFR